MNRKRFLKVSGDMLFLQLKWTMMFFVIMYIGQVIKSVIAIRSGDNVSNFFINNFSASSVFMLVIGIIFGLAFLQQYVNYGVTRKDYFIGGIISATCLSIIIPIGTFISFWLEKGIVSLLNLPIHFKATMEVEETSDFISGIVETVVASTTVDTNSLTILAFCIFSIKILMFYFIGWLIGVSFYRYGVIVGLVSIGISIAAVSCYDIFWEIKANKFITKLIPLELSSMPLYLSFLSTIILMAILLTFIRSLTRNSPIKL